MHIFAAWYSSKNSKPKVSINLVPKMNHSVIQMTILLLSQICGTWLKRNNSQAPFTQMRFEAILDSTVSAKTIYLNYYIQDQSNLQWTTNCEISLTPLDVIKHSSAYLDAKASNNFQKYVPHKNLSNSIQLKKSCPTENQKKSPPSYFHFV